MENLKGFNMISNIKTDNQSVLNSRTLSDFFARSIDIIIDFEVTFNLEFKKDIFQIKKYPDLVSLVFPENLQQHNLIEIRDKLFSENEVLRKKVYTL